MKTILLMLFFLMSAELFAYDILKIEVGKNYKNYSNKELRERLWRLEKAVGQLQSKVFELENKPQSNSLNTWVCTISALGDQFSATGPTKAVAKSKVINRCSKKKDDGFFCKNPTCEQ